MRAARVGHELSPSGFSALRRNELRAYRSKGSTRMVFLTPALDAKYLTAMRGQLALSSWPTWRRLVSPRTGRVELLRAADAMVRHLRWVEETTPEAAAAWLPWTSSRRPLSPSSANWPPTTRRSAANRRNAPNGS